MGARKLLMISGPIASGKSTAANALVAAFRASGRTAAVIDLDRLYMMLDDRQPMAEPSISREARRAAAALTDQFFRDGVELTIVEGTFWTDSERAEFTTCLTTPVHPVYVTLRVSVDEAQRRVASDSGRRASRIPEVLRACYTQFAAVAPIATDVTIDSTSVSAEEVVSVISAALQGEDHSDDSRADPPPLFRDIDCIQIPVPDLESGLAFYRDVLGQPLLWRTPTAAGLQMADSRAEVVVQTERPELEVNLSVTSADAAADLFVDAGAVVIVPPFDITIGRCAVLQDPWGNRLVVLDHSKGRLLTDASRQVISAAASRPDTRAEAD